MLRKTELIFIYNYGEVNINDKPNANQFAQNGKFQLVF